MRTHLYMRPFPSLTPSNTPFLPISRHMRRREHCSMVAYHEVFKSRPIPWKFVFLTIFSRANITVLRHMKMYISTRATTTESRLVIVSGFKTCDFREIRFDDRNLQANGRKTLFWHCQLLALTWSEIGMFYIQESRARFFTLYFYRYKFLPSNFK